MAYDEELAERIRAQLPDRPVEEKRMFGGLAFLVGGHMAVAASGQGGLLVRVAPDAAEELLAQPGTEPMAMRGRPMAGWLRVEASVVASDEQLAAWVDRGIGFASTLPPK
jgi:TfoX/Sxy family transcriptional regulator of competence genes